MTNQEPESVRNITIMTSDGFDSVHAAIDENFAIHRTLILTNDPLKYGYTISHIPTGRRIVVCRSLLDCKNVIKMLRKLDIDWSLDDITALGHMEEKTNFKDIYGKYDLFYQEMES